MDIEIKDGGTYRIYPIRLQGVALNAYDCFLLGTL